MQAVTEQPIQKFKFFRIFQSLSWLPAAYQKASGLWVRDCIQTNNLSVEALLIEY